MRKNVAGQVIGAQMVSATDGSAFTGEVTIYITGDGGTQAIGTVGSGICTHEGNGYHSYAPSQAETNYDLIAFTFVGSGAIPVTIQVYTEYSLESVDSGLAGVGESGYLVSLTQAKTFLRKDEAATLEEVAEYVGVGDGDTKEFDLDNTPVDGSLKLYVNGTLQTETTHYSISDATITFVTAPTDTHPITANYQYAADSDTMEDYDDDLIQMMIHAATKKCEEYSGKAYIQRAITENRIGDGSNLLKLNYRPVSTFTSITLDGTSLTEDTDFVCFDEAGLLQRPIGPNQWSTESLNSTTCWTENKKIVITYTAGLAASRASAQALAPDAVMAVLITLANWYENRLGVSKESVSGIGSVDYEIGDLPDRAKRLLGQNNLGIL